MWTLPILRKRERCPLQCSIGEVVHVVGYALGNGSACPAVRVNDRPTGEGPNPIEVPNLVKALTGWLGEYEDRPDGKRQDHIKRGKLLQLAGHLLGSRMDSHWAGFPVVGGP